MVVIETVRGVTTRVLFLLVILTSLGSKTGTPFYPNRRKHVNTILKLLTMNPLLQSYMLREWAGRATTRGSVALAAPGC